MVLHFIGLCISGIAFEISVKLPTVRLWFSFEGKSHSPLDFFAVLSVRLDRRPEKSYFALSAA